MKVFITRYAWQKMCAYTDNCQDEIGGLGKMRCEDGDFYVDDVEIYEQTVTPSTVNLTSETLAKWQVEKIKAGESLVPYTFFWHSHAAMGVFFSQTDKDTINGSTEFPYLVSLVINHKHEVTARLDIFKPVHVTVEKVDVVIIEDVNEELINLCKKEIAEKIKRPASTYGFRSHGGRTTYKWGGHKQELLPMTPAGEKEKLEKRYTSLEASYEALLSVPANKKNDKAIKRLESEMNSILYQLDMIDHPLP